VTSTAQFKFGTASEYVSANNQDIYTSAGTPTFMDYGTGEFTIELWLYITGTIGTGRTSTTADVLALDNTSGAFGFRLAQDYSNGSLSSSTPKYVNIFARGQADLDYWTLPSNWTGNTWHFLVLQRKGTTVSCWLDGSLLPRSGSGGGTRNFSSNTGQPIRVGTADTSNGVGPCYIDECCWSNTYRYTDTTASIPVPTAAFTVDSYTTQLMHMDGTNGGTTFTNATS
jgi:hypothetical protein